MKSDQPCMVKDFKDWRSMSFAELVSWMGALHESLDELGVPCPIGIVWIYDKQKHTHRANTCYTPVVFFKVSINVNKAGDDQVLTMTFHSEENTLGYACMTEPDGSIKAAMGKNGTVAIGIPEKHVLIVKGPFMLE